MVIIKLDGRWFYGHRRENGIFVRSKKCPIHGYTFKVQAKIKAK